jgi:alpha-2-macroglobulin
MNLSKKSRTLLISFSALVALAVIFYLTWSYYFKPKPFIPKFNPAISAFTAGIISSESTIRVRLASDYSGEMNPSTPIVTTLFHFSPEIKGEAFWLDNRTIEFRPEDPLLSGKTYKTVFDVYKVASVTGENKVFTFEFQIIHQQIHAEFEGIKAYDPYDYKWTRIYGSVRTADVVDNDKLETAFCALLDHAKLKMTWEHEGNRRIHHFVIDSVERTSASKDIFLSQNMDTPEKSEITGDTLIIPALDQFTLMKYKVLQQPQQCIILRFSDPLMKDQNLEGIITGSMANTLSYVVEDNEIRIFPETRQIGASSITIGNGLKNTLGKVITKSQTINISFEDLFPAVRLKGKGTILPSSNGLILPFEAVNVKAVNVKIIQIFESNICQFLQVNSLDGENELYRAGRLILKKTIFLTSGNELDYGKWNTFSLDLSKLISAQPGAIYRFEFSLLKKYSIYPCNGNKDTKEKEEEENVNNEMTEQEEEAINDNETSYWDTYQSYYDENSDYENEDYEYKERNNPCSDSYYSVDQRKVARNILASDIGIIAKEGNDRSMNVVFTDLKTTKPLSQVSFELYTYQNQLISKGKSDANGFASLSMKEKPFLLIASFNNQKGYLKLDDASTLSLSKFDVAGNVVQKGLKGFIYGERGVWRPGDSLFITFILDDHASPLPTNHPVSFELENPQGQIVKRIVKTSGLNGIYTFATTTSIDAPTGNYLANIRVGGTTFTKTLKIETIRPNRLKIALDFGKQKLSHKDQTLKGKLNVKWLHGANAHNFKTNVQVTLTEALSTFEKFPDFIFDDPVRKFTTEDRTIFDGRLDESGNALIDGTLKVATSSPGMLNASFLVKVFEEGGEFSVDRFTLPFSSYESYVGIKVPKGDKARGMLLTDTTHIIRLVTVDENGKKIDRAKVLIDIYKINWRWWWDAGDENLANYVGDQYHQPIQHEEITMLGGQASFPFTIKYPEWGRYLIRVEDPVSGHVTGKIVYVDWPGWAGRAERKDPEAAAMLTFSTDKEKYQPGEKAKVVIPTSGNGRVLVSIESASKVLKTFWVEAKEKETSFEVDITEDMAPNVYLHVMLLQAHGSTTNDLPLRMYGVLPVFVENPQTRLTPVISMPEVLRPEESATIRVSEKAGHRMTYTLAIVDDGLLDLTHFRTPDPWNSFYAREALGVKTWDMFDLVIGAYGGTIERIFSIGGDKNELNTAANKKANRFPPVVKFLGPFELAAGKINSHKIKIPQYVGSVRTMVIAADNGAYGNTEKTAFVRKPLMVLASLPRVLSPGEQVKLPVTIFALEKQIKNVQVSVQTNHLLKLEGASSHQVEFNQPGDKVINFDLTVPSSIGIAKVHIWASCGVEKAEYTMEVQVRNPNSKVTSFIDAIIQPGKDWTSSYSLPGIAGTNKATLELSRIPSLDFGRRLKYLLDYPHGCVEQTTSAVFPQLFLADVMDLSDGMKRKTEENIKVGIQRLMLFQQPDGGLSYWPDEKLSNEWATSYAGHFMIEAADKGFALPANFRKPWIKYQKKAARNWASSKRQSEYGEFYQGDLEQAYRLYTLARAKEPEISAMNKLREVKNLSLQACWRLAAAYAITGHPEVAKDLLKNASVKVKDYSGFSSSFGSKERDMAMLLETLSLMNEKEKGISLAQDISKALCSDMWMSTQTTSYCLIAMSKFAGSAFASGVLRFSYSLNGNKAILGETKFSVYQTELKVKGVESGSISISNKSSGMLFARMTLEGIPEAGHETDDANEMTMSVVYKDMKGNPLDVSRLVQGTDFQTDVVINNPGGHGNYTNIALTQIFPSGWEIINSRLDPHGDMNVSISQYQDFRDDRVLTYFNLAPGNSKRFVVRLNASYLGKYYLPLVSAEAMYDQRIFARKKGQWVEVIKQKD